MSKRNFSICILILILLAPCALEASNIFVQKTVKSPLGEAHLVLDKRYIAFLLALDTTFPDDFRIGEEDLQLLFDSYRDKVSVSPDFKSYLRSQQSLRTMVDIVLTEWNIDFEVSSMTNFFSTSTTSKTRALQMLLRVFEADNQEVLDSLEQKLMERAAFFCETILSRPEWERLPAFSMLMPITAYILVGNNMQSVEGMASRGGDASSSRLAVCMGSSQGDVLVFFHELAHVLYQQTSTTEALLRAAVSAIPDGFLDELVQCCKKLPNVMDYLGNDTDSMIRHCIEAPYMGFNEFFAYSVSHYVVAKYFADMPHSRTALPDWTGIADSAQWRALSSFSGWLTEHDVYERMTMNMADKAFWWDLFQGYVACVNHDFEYARAHGIGVFR